MHVLTHNTVHVQVEAVELDAVRIGVSHIDRYGDFIAFIIGYLLLLGLYDRKNLDKGSIHNVSTEKVITH